MMMSRITVAILLGASASAAAADWPRFRGPEGQAVAGQARVLLRWDATTNVVWKTALPGAGASSPSILGQRIYLTSYTGYGLDEENPGEKSSLRYHVLCLDRPSGRILWDRTLEPQTAVPSYARFIARHGYASPTPAADERAVYVVFGGVEVSAWTHDGARLWSRKVGGEIHGWGAGTSPILHGDVVIVAGNGDQGDLVGLEARTGREVWRRSGIAKCWSTPIVVRAGGRAELVLSMKDRIAAYDPASGKVLWTCAGVNDYVCPSPVAHQDVVFAIGGRKNTAIAVRVGGTGDVSGSRTLWRLDKGSNVPSPVYHEGHLYWARDNGRNIYCVDAKAGSVVYD